MYFFVFERMFIFNKDQVQHYKDRFCYNMALWLLLFYSFCVVLFPVDTL